MVQTAVGAVVILSTIALALLLPVALVWVLMHVGRGLYWVVSNLFRGVFMAFAHVGRFLRSTIVDALGVVGGVLTGLALIPLTIFNVLIGRWSAATHYAGALQDEAVSAGLSAYRLALGNPIRFLGLSRLTDGIEKRLPEVVARAPRAERPLGGKKSFDGYKVVGSLPAGGSGAKLFLAQPQAAKAEMLAAAGMPGGGKVVIKAFDLASGSTLPQIVRESRSLEHAKRLGLVLDHDLSPSRFWYAMPYVPGEDLGIVSRRLHEASGDKGLLVDQLDSAVGYGCDLLQTLQRFHAIGLWHKDIKPSNIIVSGGRAHLVDLGLVTPLSSAMTLTTHGTEYFRDPEMVRLAMRGVKVHEVDGVKFDLYSTGAVLYSMIENSFPAHGSLSRLSKPVPQALEWIMRRAMADLKDRYPSATEMLADLRAVHEAEDPFALLPAQLPSVRGEIPEPPRFEDASYAGTTSKNAPAAAFASAAASPAFGSTPAATATRRGARRAASAPSTPRRRRRARRVAAALFVVGIVWASGLVFLTRGVGSRHMRAADAQHEVYNSTYTRSENLPEWIHQLDQSVREVRERREVAGARNKRAGKVTENAPQAFVSHGRIVILDDLPPKIDSDLIEELKDLLSEERFEVIDERSADDAEDIRLMAGARAAVGLGTPRDPATLERLEEYVSEEADLEAVLWLASANSEGHVLYHYFAKGGALTGDLSHAELRYLEATDD